MIRPVLSVVIPVFNEESVLPTLYRRLTEVLARTGEPFELLLVDDGSNDGTWAGMQALRVADPRVSLLRLSRNFGHQLAITAGLDHARGDAVVVMDADLQDPPEVVLEMLTQWRAGFDVVYGVRSRREGETIFKRATAAAFYRLIRVMTSVNIPADTGDFRLMSRRAVEAFKQARERNRFVRGMVAWVGFRQTGISYVRASRHIGESKYPLRKMVRFATDALVSFSTVPLRVASWLGFISALFAFLYAGWAVYLKLVLKISLPGWSSLMVAVMFLGAVQLVSIGILGEYLGRIYDEVKHRPLYLVQHFEAEGSEQSDGG